MIHNVGNVNLHFIKMTNRANNHQAAELMRRLEKQGRKADSDLELAESALLLAGLDRPEIDLSSFRSHLSKIACDVADSIPSGRKQDAIQQARILSEVLSDRHKYSGDTLTYDDPQNADLIRVIERRKGLPVALAILYIHAAQEQGWAATGINFPGHFLIRLEYNRRQVIVDPFNGGIQLSVADLIDLLKQLAGADAVLRSEYYEPLTNRQVLIRLLNNIKIRADTMGDQDRVLQILDRMTLVAPDNLGLMRESGICYAKSGNMRRAIELFENFLLQCNSNEARRDVQVLLQHVRTKLN